MALFKVNTGCREQEVCNLRWEYEREVPELNTSVFVIPKELVKNGHERLVVLNRVARSVIDSQRGLHPEFVFVHSRSKKAAPKPVASMNNTGWRSARERAADKWAELHGKEAAQGFRRVRVHDLKHTFGARLRAVDVSFEDRQDLLGHKSHRITTHYSSPDVGKLIAAAEKACDENAHNYPTTTWLMRKAG
jgi:integrase